MAAISAEQHNMTRRAVKARQRKGTGVRKSAASTFSLDTARKEQLRHKQWQEQRHRNGLRLLAIVDTKGVWQIERPTFEDDFCSNYDDYSFAVRGFEQDISDVKRAAKASPNRYHWEDTPDGGFRIARVRK